jgi:hypothetical protein
MQLLSPRSGASMPQQRTNVAQFPFPQMRPNACGRQSARATQNSKLNLKILRFVGAGLPLKQTG